jgi:hypothetical protein
LPEVNRAIEQLWLNGTLQNIYQNGGAKNAAQGGPTVLEKYGLWNDSQSCITNFFPVNPGHVANCPPNPGP